MAAHPSNTANERNANEYESVADESTPLLKGPRVVAAPIEHSASRAACHEDEELGFDFSPSDKETQVDHLHVPSQNIAGVISVLLLGKFLISLASLRHL
jgi:hypothetical protein